MKNTNKKIWWRDPADRDEIIKELTKYNMISITNISSNPAKLLNILLEGVLKTERISNAIYQNSNLSHAETDSLIERAQQIFYQIFVCNSIVAQQNETKPRNAEIKVEDLDLVGKRIGEFAKILYQLGIVETTFVKEFISFCYADIFQKFINLPKYQFAEKFRNEAESINLMLAVDLVQLKKNQNTHASQYYLNKLDEEISREEQEAEIVDKEQQRLLKIKNFREKNKSAMTLLGKLSMHEMEEIDDFLSKLEEDGDIVDELSPAIEEYINIVLYQKAVYNPDGNTSAADKIKKLGIDISDLKTYQKSVDKIYEIVDAFCEKYDLKPDYVIHIISIVSRGKWQEMNILERMKAALANITELSQEIAELE